jgi:D-alanyl-D-alanine dipeptidase
VQTADWTATTGTLQRYDKHLFRWRAVGTPIDVVIGRSGLAWGRGLHSTMNGPQKREGDGKSPAGAFTLGTAFGFESRAPWKLPYLPLRETTECVDDSASTFYNQVVERTAASDWKSSEKMRTVTLYKWGVVVSHNTPAFAGAGSCIFLHIWSGPRSTTSGCTAMREEDLVTLLRWIDPKQSPRLVQLPREEYERLRRDWSLP